MKCPEGLTWIPDREYCSRCKPGYAWNAEWSECVKMDRTVINPGGYHTATASLFGWEQDSFARRAIATVAAATALGGSIWAHHREKCSKCQSPPLFFGAKLPLAQAGMGYYSILLYGTASNRDWAPKGLGVAAAVHALLIAYMLGTKQVCPACMLTGISAIIAAGVTNAAHLPISDGPQV